jgi:phosphatidylserine/phosphatidylglycerophosphate/cardiolipin synthase-like enzyme
LGGRRSQNGGLGSFNFTKAAKENNGENLRVIQDASRAAKRAENWQKIGAFRIASGTV